MTFAEVPIDFKDAVNARILAVSEDRLQGFQRDPLGAIAQQSGVELPVVIERIQAMLRAGTIRRVRQTLLATNLAQGALVAWQVPQDRLDAAFDFMFQQDPFSGHVVIRSTDAATPGSNYKLWTTVKVPQGFSLQKHCEFLAKQTGAEKFRLLQAKRLFALGVGHTRRRGMEPGSKAEVPAEATEVKVVELSDLEWRILTALKREFGADELTKDLWQPRAEDAGVSLKKIFEVAEDFNRRGIIG
ncbi:MAG TPA: Lrp/AsnC family transcriptional regulator, partial [Blastocatellia bacterium]|nr:Lrp/AsnC family transcriptional regulator [Blastocatellia bacterium]